MTRTREKGFNDARLKIAPLRDLSSAELAEAFRRGYITRRFYEVEALRRASRLAERV